MKASTDEREVHEAWLDTPFAAPNAISREEAFSTPGCHVKSKETTVADVTRRWPRYFGRLASSVDDVFVVVSKPPQQGIDGKPTVWTGTFAQYAAMWECD